MKTRERISWGQMLAMMICFEFGTVLRSTILSSVLSNDSWMVAITGAIAFLPLLLTMVALSRRFPGMSLMDINNQVLGPYVGGAFSVIYGATFFSICAINALDASKFVISFLMPRTPLVAILILYMLACCYAVRKGIEPLARIASILALGSLLLLLSTSTLTIKDAHPINLLPMFRLPFIDYVRGTHSAATIHYGESMVFLSMLHMLGPHDKLKKPIIIESILTVVLIAFIQVRETLTLGNLLPYVAHPNFETIRMIDIGTILTRLESIYAFIMISLTLYKMCMLFYAATYSISKITRMENPRPLALPMAAMVVIFALHAHLSKWQTLDMAVNVSPFILTVVEFLMPMGTLLIAVLRGQGKRAIPGGKAVAK